MGEVIPKATLQDQGEVSRHSLSTWALRMIVITLVITHWGH